MANIFYCEFSTDFAELEIIYNLSLGLVSLALTCFLQFNLILK